MNNIEAAIFGIASAIALAGAASLIFDSSTVETAVNEATPKVEINKHTKSMLDNIIPEGATKIKYIKSRNGYVTFVKYGYDGECFMGTSGMKQRGLTKIDCRYGDNK